MAGPRILARSCWIKAIIHFTIPMHVSRRATSAWNPSTSLVSRQLQTLRPSFYPGTTTPCRFPGIKAMASKREKKKKEDADQEWIDSIAEGDDEELLQGGFEKVVLENQEWGAQALEAAMKVLEGKPDLELYYFKAMDNQRIDIRLDKLSDTYGSPDLDEIGEFSLAYNNELESILGEEKAGEIEVEVSSPGAERAVSIPDEFERFQGLPMVVRTVESPEPRILEFLGTKDDNLSLWKFADVRANRALGKGRGLSKKQKESIYEIDKGDFVRVNLHIDL